MIILNTAILGLFIFLGTFISLKVKTKKDITAFSLSTCLIVMIYLIFDLFHHSFELANKNLSTLVNLLIIISLIIGGFVILKLLDKFIPHHDCDCHHEERLNHVGIISSVALIIHNIIEGIAVSSASITSLNVVMMIGVGLHNIPLGMMIASTFKEKNNDNKVLLISLAISLSTVIGGVITMFIGNINNIISLVLNSITLGMMIYITCLEVFPKVKKNISKKETKYGLLLGLIIVILLLFVFSH